MLSCNNKLLLFFLEMHWQFKNEKRIDFGESFCFCGGIFEYFL